MFRAKCSANIASTNTTVVPESRRMCCNSLPARRRLSGLMTPAPRKPAWNNSRYWWLLHDITANRSVGLHAELGCACCWPVAGHGHRAAGTWRGTAPSWNPTRSGQRSRAGRKWRWKMSSFICTSVLGLPARRRGVELGLCHAAVLGRSVEQCVHFGRAGDSGDSESDQVGLRCRRDQVVCRTPGNIRDPRRHRRGCRRTRRRRARSGAPEGRVAVCRPAGSRRARG